MINKNKKIISMAITFCYIIILLFSCVGGAAAAQGLTEKQIFELKAFGIIEGDQSGELNLEDNITRAEFTKLVIKLLRLDATAESINLGNGFNDVDPSHWAYRYISLAAYFKLINGDEAHNFYPNNNVTFNQAVKILVLALGYGEEAEKAGGYPNGYLVMGVNSKLLKDIVSSGEGPITRATALRLIYNCLDANRLVNIGYGGATEVGLASETLRDILMGDENNGFVKMTGIVTANYDTWLTRPLPNIKPNEVEIDNLLFDKGTTNADQYLGQEVDVYVSIAEGRSIPVIKEIRPTKNNTIVNLTFDRVVCFDSSGIEYETEDSKDTEKCSFADGAVFVYNGRVITDLSLIDIENMQDGGIRLVSNKDEKEINVVFIDEYQSFVVDVVRPDDMRIYFLGDKLLNGQKCVLLGEDDDVTSYVTDADYKEIKLDDIKKGDVISIYSSLDGELVRVILQREEIEGRVTEVNSDEHEVVINGKTYKLEKGIDGSKLMGEDISAVLNFEGKIAHVDEIQGLKRYGAIVDLEEGKGVDKKVMLQIAIPDLIADDIEEINTDDESVDKEIPAITAKNKSLEVFNVASCLRFNGATYNGSEILGVLQQAIQQNATGYLVISYSLNSENEINQIETLIPYRALYKRPYNSYEKTFGKVKGAFGIDEKTLAICIPNNDTPPSDDDYLARISMNNGQEYRVAAYQYNEDTHCPDIILINETMHYKTTGTISNSSKIALVSKVTTTINSDGEEVHNIVMVTPDGEKKYEISNQTTSTADFAALSSGDLIKYSLDLQDRVDGYELIESLDPLPTIKYESGKELFNGYIQKVEYDVVSEVLNKWVDVITMQTNDGYTKAYEIPKKSSPPIYIYDTQKKTARLASHVDLLVKHKQATVYVADGSVKVVAIAI